MNLVVIARRPEIAERGAATIQALTGRHPSRTIVVQSADPDGPSWLDARVEAHCILPREDAPETCAETIHLTAGGEAGRHLAAIVTPLIIHDLPVTVWWPGEPPFTSRAAHDLLDRGRPPRRRRLDLERRRARARLREMARPRSTQTRSAVSDFALVRQSRWREAIASIFDDPDFLPYLRSLRRIAVTYATHDETGAPGSTNLVKPIYHVAWLGIAARADASSSRCAVATKRRPRHGSKPRSAPGARPAVSRGLAATLSDGRARGRGRHPPGRLADAGRHDAAGRAARRAARLRAARGRDRRGRDGPRARLAGRRRGARAAVPRRAPRRRRPAGRGDRGRPRDPVAVGTLRAGRRGWSASPIRRARR